MLLLKEENNLQILFEIRSKSISQGGEICLPGGRVDKDKDEDTIYDIVFRELKEELNISPSEVEILGKLPTIIAPMGTVVDSIVGVINKKIEEIQFNAYEVESIFALPLQFFIVNLPQKFHVEIKIHPTKFNEATQREEILLPIEDLGISERYKRPWGNLKYNVYAYKTAYGTIWGITARIIANFVSLKLIMQIKKDYNIKGQLNT